MKNNIKLSVEKSIKQKTKKKTISFTLSGSAVFGLEEEAKRLETNKSFLMEMIIQNYLLLPITDENLKSKKEGDKGKK